MFAIALMNNSNELQPTAGLSIPSNESTGPERKTESEDSKEEKQSQKSHANPLASQIGGRMYDNRDKTGDIKFKIGNAEIAAHKCVLASLSPKYEAQFYGDFDDKSSESIEVKDVSAAAFEEFLQLFYRVQVHFTHENIEDVITLAKVSLVDEFVTACMEFLTETLAIENVCQSYHLAVMHEFEPLIEHCEQMISLNSDEVFTSNGFITCNRVAFFNILQLDALSTKEVEVFKASISWAKNDCAANGLDATKPENLRKALADSLYQIRFGTMSVDEFMHCYKTYKNIFTESEREEILFVIGNVFSSECKMFNDEPRGILYQKWDEKCSIKCDRVLSEVPTVAFQFGVSKTSFSCNQPVLLGGFSCNSIAETSGTVAEKSMPVTVMLLRKRQLNSVNQTTLFKGIENLTFKTQSQTVFRFQRPVMIKPNFFYEIQIEFKNGLSMKDYKLRDKVYLNNHVTIEFHETKSSIRSLILNICKEDSTNRKRKNDLETTT